MPADALSGLRRIDQLIVSLRNQPPVSGAQNGPPLTGRRRQCLVCGEDGRAAITVPMAVLLVLRRDLAIRRP